MPLFGLFNRPSTPAKRETTAPSGSAFVTLKPGVEALVCGDVKAMKLDHVVMVSTSDLRGSELSLANQRESAVREWTNTGGVTPRLYVMAGSRPGEDMTAEEALQRVTAQATSRPSEFRLC